MTVDCDSGLEPTSPSVTVSISDSEGHGVSGFRWLTATNVSSEVQRIASAYGITRFSLIGMT